MLLVGALARDLHVRYRFGIDQGRETEDIDFGFVLDDGSTFHKLRTMMYPYDPQKAVSLLESFTEGLLEV